MKKGSKKKSTSEEETSEKSSKKRKVINCMDRGNNFINHREMFERMGRDFDVVCTNSTRRIDIHGGNRYMYSDAVYKFNELNMFKELKKEVRRNIEQKNISVPSYSAKDVKYFCFSNVLRSVQPGQNVVISKGIELDIKMAYYVTAHRLGYISREFFLKCEGLPKLQRLRLIGSIATNKMIYEYRGGELVNSRSEKDELLRRVWFHICWTVDQCMQEFSYLLRERFLFYWVDGIYMTGNWNLPDALVYSAAKNRYRFSPVRINKFDISCNEDNVVIMNIHKNDGTVKPFNVQRGLRDNGLRLIDKYRAILEQNTE